MNRTLLKLAAGALILSGIGGAVATTISPKMLREAAKAADKAAGALKEHKGEQAVRFAERSVLFNPQSADARALLGQAYLQSGRFGSAETAFSDALRLSPSHSRAALGLALASTALGKTSQALSTLASARGLIADVDIGLAMALAGDRDGAIAVLEPVARSNDSSAKARQNLALAFALAGRWDKARATAAQDISPDMLDKRMAEWAKFVRPVGSADQVASLLGVRPAHDAGLPTQLALIEEAPAAPVAALAAVEAPVSVPAAVSAPTPAIVEPTPVAEVAPAPAPAVMAAPAPAIAAAPVPAPVLATPAPLPQVKAKAEIKPYLMMATAVAPKPVVAKPMFIKPVALPASRVAAKPASGGSFVVQLGAFSSEDRLERAWNGTIKHASWLGGYSPVSMSFAAPQGGRTLYRLAVDGFSSRIEAVNICRKVREMGADCFVRGRASDSPVRWVSRKTGTAYASR